MIDPSYTPPTPTGLRRAGKRLWKDMTETYQLRIDGLRLLEMACRTADELALIDKALATAAPMVEGPRGRLVPNPLLEEARRHRATYMRALGQLGVEAADGDSRSRSTHGRRLAAERWRGRGA
jgi:hypothetical protein